MRRSPHTCRPHLLVLLLAGFACGKQSVTPGTTGSDEREVEGPLTGLRVLASEDLSGDGAPDVVVSSPGLFGDGALYLFDASLVGDQASGDALAVVEATETEALGEGLAACPDLNGDGATDLAIGLPRGNGARGGLWLLSGPFTGTRSTDDGQFIRGTKADAQTGYSIDCGGDIDGDGRSDLLFSAPMADGFGLAKGTGEAYLHTVLDGGGTDAIANFSTTWNDAQLGYEQSLKLGDLDGDGLADAVIGSHGSSQMYVLFAPHRGSLVGNDEGYRYVGREDSDAFGYSAALGDLNGDGHLDIAVGAPWWGPQRGAVGIIDGPLVAVPPGEGGDVVQVDRWVDGQDPKSYTGFAVDIADDLDGDGIGDLVIGAPGATTSGPDAGVAYGLYGPATGAGVIVAEHVFVGNTTYGRLGHSVAAVPDSNGDGLDEVLFGVPYLDVDGRIGAGAALLFHSPHPARIDDVDATARFIF